MTTNTKANEAKAAKARAAEIAKVITREQSLIKAEGDARAAFKAATVGRFADKEKLEPADLKALYTSDKTCNNRVAELNRAQALAATMGAAQAVNLFEATELLGRGRLRDTWAQAVTFAMNACREVKAADGNPKTEAVNIVREWRDALEQAVKLEAAQAEFQKANRAATQAETQARVAAERCARLEAKAEAGDANAADQLKAAEQAATKAGKAATTARAKADKAKAALPAKALPAPRTEAKRVQDVKAAVGDEAPSRMLLAALLGDVVQLATKCPGIPADEVDALRDVLEKWNHK